MAVNFRVIKSKSDKIIGMEISGDGSTESKEYCSTFFKALSKGSGDLKFKDGSVFFIRHNGYPPETYSFQLKREVYETLKRIIHPRNPNLRIQDSPAWSGSFKIFVKDA
jgi:hypothetical protein